MELKSLIFFIIVGGKFIYFECTLSRCMPPFENYNQHFGCKLCDPCRKGTGFVQNETVSNISCHSCLPCEPGSFQSRLYAYEECQKCDTCDHSEMLRNCTPEKNSLCGDCEPGYRYEIINELSICMPIKSKASLNRKIPVYIYIILLLYYFMT